MSSEKLSLLGFIEETYGSQMGMDRYMSWPMRTCHRYYNKTPGRFMTEHKKLRRSIDLNLLSKLVEARESELLDKQSEPG